MSISEEINAIRDKYAPKDLKLKPSHYCRNPYALSLGECARCGICGRSFDDNGNVISEAEPYIKNGIDTRPIQEQLDEAFGWEGK